MYNLYLRTTAVQVTHTHQSSTTRDKEESDGVSMTEGERNSEREGERNSV